jgi:hypothetical protein
MKTLNLTDNQIRIIYHSIGVCSCFLQMTGIKNKNTKSDIEEIESIKLLLKNEEN